MKHKALNKLCRDLAIQRSNYLQLIAKYSPEHQSFQPNPHSWSMLNVCEHLMLSDRGFKRMIEKSLTYPPKPLLWHSHLRLLFVRNLFKLPLRLPVPIPQIVPQSKLSFTELRSEWAAVWEDWNQLIENFPEDRVKDAVARHPRFGWLSIEQILKFLLSHYRHHASQFKRIEAALSEYSPSR